LESLASTSFIKSAVCNANGEIYGVDKSSNLRKYAEDWSNTIVGQTGYYPNGDSELNCGAAIDFRTGLMYWSFYGSAVANPSDDERNVNGVVVVNLNDASSELIWNYPYNERFSSLTVQNSHPLAPDNVYDLTFTPEVIGSSTGVLSFTVPAVTYSQQAITSDYELEWFLDNETQGTYTVTPGATYTQKVDNIADGNHTAAILLRANGHVSNTAYATSYFGVDTPQAVKNLTLTYDAETSEAKLTWDISNVGANGGTVDVDNIRYKITRYPGGELVARSAKGTSYTETMTEPFNLYYYKVAPYNAGNTTQQGSSSTSNKIKMGSPRTLPYSESFDTESSLNAYTIIDANGDGGDEWEDHNWKYDSQYYCAFYYGGQGYPADDWLITPALDLDPSKIYKLTFKYYAYYGYGSRFRVVAGTDATVEGMDDELLDKTTVSSFSDYPGITETIYFAPKPGTKYIGFHHLSTTMEHLSIDDIKIVSYMDATVPAVVENLAATANADGTVNVSFKLPTVNAADAALEGPVGAKIFKAGSTIPVATITDKNPGDQIVWTDESAIQGKNSYSVYATNAYGNGLSSDVSIDLSTGIPVAVAQVNATVVNPNQVVLEWTPSTATEDSEGRSINTETIRYNVYRQLTTDDTIYYNVIARDLKDCRYVDNNPNEYYDGGQHMDFYYVTPINETGEGSFVASNGVFLGEIYDLPFAESWTGQATTTSPWAKTAKNNATWYVRGQGYDPLVQSHDGSGVCDCEVDYEQTYGSCGLVTPRMDLTTLKNPKLTFWMYRAASYPEDVKLAVYIDQDDAMQYVPNTTYSANSDTDGWVEIEVPLDAYSNLNCASIVIMGYVQADNTLHIDDFKVTGDNYEKELSIYDMKGVSEGRSNEETKFYVTVKNVGTQDSADFNVDYLVDGHVIDMAEVSGIAVGAEKQLVFSYTPDDDEVGIHTVTATIESNNSDTNSGNNSISCIYEVKKQNLAWISTIKGVQNDDAVVLTWNMPDTAESTERVFDDVEGYDKFAIDNVGSWTMYDGDEGYNYYFQGDSGVLTWDNYNVPQAFIVFDPTVLNVSTLPFTPYSGNQAFVSWACATSQNDDWLISPELSGDAQLVSFLACSAVSGSEPFYFWASSTGTEPTDFVRISGADAINTSTTWRYYHYALPEGTKYFAINYIGKAGNGLVIDDLIYEAYPLATAPDGYNVYRNGVKLNKELVKERTFSDSNIESYTDYRYTVAPVYNGCESRKSEECLVSTSGAKEVTVTDAVIYAKSGRIYIANAAGKAAAVYAANGLCVANYNSVDNAEVAVAPGVYIVKVADKVVKLTVK
jgi:hypothetical protein